MMQLRRLNLVQFFLFQEHSLPFLGNVAILGPNGHGKSTLLDAIQIAMLGADGRYLSYNAQSVSEKKKRSLRDYCLGVIGHPEKGTIEGQARTEALTYISLVFANEDLTQPITVGICVEASQDDNKHQFNGAFILPGVGLKAHDFMETTTEGRQPMLHRDFIHMARRRCAEVGREAFLTDKRSEYVRELVLNISPHHRRPDPERFAKAFVKSLTLKEADSIDEFVRHHLLDEGPVEVESFGRQLRQLSEFQVLVEKTQARIAKLTDADKHYRACENAAVEMAVLAASRASIATEKNSEAISTLEEEIDKNRQAWSAANESLKSLEISKKSLGVQCRNLEHAIANNEIEKQRLDLSAQIAIEQERLDLNLTPIRTRFLELSATLAQMEAGQDQRLSQQVQECRAVISRATELISTEPNAALQIYKEQSSRLSELQYRATQYYSQLLQQKNDLDQQKTELKTRIDAFKKHGVDVGSNVGRLLAALSERGISATPISSLVEITDPKWQPVIEGYLGTNRFALVIEDGKTKEAIKVLRLLDEQSAVYDVSIVQPRHFDGFKEPSGPDLVANLLTSNNGLALAFLQRAFGKLRQAKTEGDLESMPLALTQDGMLSKGGGTKRIRLIPHDRCAIGASFAGDNTQLLNKAARIQKDELTLKDALKSAEKSTQGLREQDDSKYLAEHVSKAVKAKERVSSDTNKLNSLDTSELEPIRMQLEDVLKQITQIDGDEKRLNHETGGLDVNHVNLNNRLKLHNDAADKLSLIESEALQHSRFDADSYAKKMKLLENSFPGSYDARLNECHAMLNRSESRLNRHASDAAIVLSEYISSVDQDFIRLEAQEMISDWQAGFKWVSGELLTLKSTRLAEQEQSVRAAKQRAERSFRTDIVSKLNESFRRIEENLKELNRLLGKCPPFSGNERYSFKWDAAKDKKAMYDFIKGAGEADDMFSSMSPEVAEQVNELIAAAANPDTFRAAAKGLTDPRGFFVFDLKISVGGQVVDMMSSRQGAGSNGEHRTPMYVAAGAALARAYRLEGKSSEDGRCGVMLLDEAFYGMDSNNAHATATFLTDLGLQLIMAAPDSDQSKMMPICKTIYEIDREYLDVDLQRSELLEGAWALMTSDSPSCHPELIEQHIAALQQESS